MSIITEIKESFIRGLKREKSDNERFVENLMLGGILIILLVSSVELAKSPVEFHGKMEIKGDIDINALQGYAEDSGRYPMTLNNITIEGDFRVPAYVFSALMKEK